MALCTGIRGAGGRRHLARLLASGALALVAACESRATGAARVTADATTAAVADTAELAPADTAPVTPGTMPRPAAPADTSRRAARPARLSPLADTISGYLVFAPVGERWFTVSSRNRRTFVDIGRVDIGVRRDSARAAAYREAVEKRATVRVGARFRLRGPWGAEDVTAAAVDTWNGRIVLRLAGSPTMDSLARARTALIASAYRTDSVAEATRDTCDRAAPLPPALEARLAQIRDSLTAELRAGTGPPYERLRRRLSIASSQVTGCFGPSRVALVVSLKAGNVEWVRERVVLVDSVGRVTPLRVSDYRFRAHDLLVAFDADGDGVDDLATRATTERAGATTLLVLDLDAKRLTRLAAGFAWEEP